MKVVDVKVYLTEAGINYCKGRLEKTKYGVEQLRLDLGVVRGHNPPRCEAVLIFRPPEHGHILVKAIEKALKGEESFVMETPPWAKPDPDK